MAKMIKKAQDGYSIGAQVVKENKRQQRRLARIKETNPERASKVEGRMVRRANRAMNATGAASRMKTGGAVKKKMKNGGSLSGLTASNKRDNGTDPNGAWTKVQERTLAGARGKAKLTADKQLGATKMTAKKTKKKVSKKK
jgi:hypothetical protein